jgi:hypothetical protein
MRAARRKTAMIDPATGKPRDVLAGFPASLSSFTRNGMDLEIFFSAPQAANWTQDLAKFAFDLTKKNMEGYYTAAPDWGWKDSKKRSELLDSDTRYLFVRQRSGENAGQLVAFTSFRFFIEGAFDILYLFELQLSDAVQRKGLGKHLMVVLELAAKQLEMQM